MIKIKNNQLVYAALFVLSVVGCGPSTNVVPDSSQREANIAERQKMIKGFDEKIATLQKSIENGKAKLADASHEARLKYQNQLDALTKKFDKATEIQKQLKDSINDSADTAWDKAKLGMETVSEEIGDYAQKVEEMLTKLQDDIRNTDRQKIIDQFEAKLTDLELKIEEGKKKLSGVSAEMRGKYEEQVAELTKKQHSAKEKLEELKKAAKDGTSDAWDKVKTGLEATWESIHAAGQKFLDSFKS